MSHMESVEKVRAFNRFYMPSMNLLGNHYLGSEYSITEARVFFEIYENEGCNAAHIAQIMNIDKSYLSRIIKAEDFINTSNRDIETILQNLSDEDEQCLINAIDTIINLLSKKKGRD